LSDLPIIVVSIVRNLPFADLSGRAVSDMNCLRSLEYWDRGFESHSRDVCLCMCLFCVCVSSGLATG
jgi:hypothetical protein